MTPEELVEVAPALIRMAGVEPTADDIEGAAILLRRRRPQPLPARATEPLPTIDLPFWRG